MSNHPHELRPDHNSVPLQRQRRTAPFASSAQDATAPHGNTRATGSPQPGFPQLTTRTVPTTVPLPIGIQFANPSPQPAGATPFLRDEIPGTWQKRKLMMARTNSQLTGGAAKTTLLLAVVVVAFLGSVFLLLGSYKRQSAQEAALTAKDTELATLRQQSTEIERLTAQNQQLQRLKEDNRELVQLRGEVAALRPLKAQAETLTTIQNENQQLQAQVRKLQNELQQVTSLRNQNQQLQSIITERMEAAQIQTCVANLRSIEAAKTAWAADFQRRPVDIPVDTDLFGPDAYIPAKPACPANGTYTLGAAQDAPTCSVPGHNL